jgi:CheY-specific phosphatase CheX
MLLKEDLTKALVDSVKDAFKTMLSVELTDHEQQNLPSTAELICTIGLAGKMEGSVSVSLSGVSACAIVSKMLCTEITEISQDVCDGMGEVVNVVAGGIKTRVVPLNCSFEVSIPTVVRGKQMYLNVAEDLDRISRRFEGDGISFEVELIYKIAVTVKPQESDASAVFSKMSAFERLKALTAKSKV